MQSKIISPAYLPVLCEELRHEGNTIVFTNGVFDLLHPGHIQYLTDASELGTYLIVALNTDESVRRIKGPTRPVVKLEERLEVMAALEPVHFVTWFSEDTPAEIIRMVRPDVLVKGGDWPRAAIVGKDTVEAYGGTVLSIPMLPGYSTTSILRKISEL
ncbi:MAG TPA: D-glycero-beta-D-manno-heptose 1-phosphate adenylyltransferase [Acidobacteriota bacterium]|nr:D-glycero-beta-D-manno-heptose 1-phosphate adenylyltransferase [Acidobacteriota bacterium]